jgi:hypothetical protein
MSWKLRKKNKKLKIPRYWRKETFAGRPLKIIGRLPAMTITIDDIPIEDYYNQEYNKLLLNPLPITIDGASIEDYQEYKLLESNLCFS